MSGIINSVGSKSGVISGKNIEAINLVGTISAFGMTAIPTGWLLCNDDDVLRVGIYGALFNAIGTTWGTGDGSTTFNVPDLEGAFLRGAGTSSGFTANHATALAAKENDAMQGHHHVVKGRDTNSGSTASVFLDWTSGDYHTLVAKSDPVVEDPKTDGSSGTPRTANETRPNNIGVRFYIKF